MKNLERTQLGFVACIQQNLSFGNINLAPGDPV